MGSEEDSLEFGVWSLEFGVGKKDLETESLRNPLLGGPVPHSGRLGVGFETKRLRDRRVRRRESPPGRGLGWV